MRKKIAVVLAIVLLLMSSAGGTLAYMIAKTPSLINTFAPEVEPTNGLTVTKTVIHPYGESYEIPEGITFGFTISLGEYYALKEVKTSAGLITADEAGDIKISLKHGEKFTVTELFEGTAVSVTETTSLPGFSADEITKSGVISESDIVKFDFVNTYTPELPAEKITFTGEKILTGRPWQEGDVFTFAIDKKNGEEWTNLGTTEAKIDAKSFDFTGLIPSLTYGTHSFRITEIEGETEGVSYDSTVNYFDIIITDTDMDGFMEVSEVTATNNAKVTVTEGGYNVHSTFTNSYETEGSAEFIVNITKTLTDLAGTEKTPAGFRFVVTDGVNTYTSEPTTAAGETSVVLKYGPEDAGKTYKYTLSEVNDGIPGIIYDESIIEFEVSVIDNLDGTVKAVLKDTESTSISAGFENTYDPTDAKITFSGNKELTGRDPVAEEFSFDLIMGEEVIDSAKNDADGKFTFKELTYDKVGTYNYTIREDASAKLGGITYDESSFEVTVTVTDAGGELKAEYTVKDNKEIRFVNTYKAERAVVSLGGKKILRGKELKDGMFTFHIYQTDSTYEINAAALDDALNLAEGSFTFDNLSFENVGEYYFVIKEDTRNPMDRMTYDTTAYAVKVTISDGLEGRLLSETKISELGGKVAGSVVFENIYTPKPEDRFIEVGIIKTVVNTGTDKISPEGFEFVVENTLTGAKFTGVSGKDGNASIGLTFTEDDIGKRFDYKVYEKNTAVDGVTYSSAEYAFSVEVSLSEDNEIILKSRVAGEDVESLEFAFENIYHKIKDPSSPPTGDNTMWMMYIGIMWIFLLAIVKVIKKRKDIDK